MNTIDTSISYLRQFLRGGGAKFNFALGRQLPSLRHCNFAFNFVINKWSHQWYNDVNDKQIISDEFNDYFVNIGPKLASNIDNTSNPIEYAGACPGISFFLLFNLSGGGGPSSENS